jgi:glycerol-3-phosphate dehydrogenase
MIEVKTSPFVRPQSIAKEHFPVVIIGAGINGVGVYRDLCLQGVKCLLIDQSDIGSGASSAPSRMIHGGLRYLENAEFALVKESANERNDLLRTAPHLVHPLPTVIPLKSRTGGLFASALRFFGASPKGQSRGAWAVSLGLHLYDVMGRKKQSVPRHSLTAASIADKALLGSDVQWTAHFYDAWISHPERLMHELIAVAHYKDEGSRVSTYCRFERCEGNLLFIRDEVDGTSSEVTADLIINAAGAWIDHIGEALSTPTSRIVGTKGSHLVIDHPELVKALNGRMVYFEANDGRVCIVYPFLGKILAGSTDIPVDHPEEAITEEAEITYILKVLTEVFPKTKISRENIVYTYVGVRPLAQMKKVGADPNKPGKISRDHHVILDPPQGARSIPVVSLVGGKWTTFRSLAEHATDLALKTLGRRRNKSTFGLTEPLPNLGFDDQSIQSIEKICRLTGVIRLSDLVIHRDLRAFLGELTEEFLDQMSHAVGRVQGWTEDQRQNELVRCRQILEVRHNSRFLRNAAT